ncbi:MAG: hypothetical protein GX433_13220 [Deltaproteobacteria bacterium]|nr:hypothetical protein [Deltaproteobacteria bacterium]
MYLRLVREGSGYRYVLRETYRDNECWKFRDLMDLGKDPAEYIEYPGGCGFYFKPEIEETLQEKGVDYTSEDLEKAFFPFIDPYVRQILEKFSNHRSIHSPWKSFSNDELYAHQQDLHSFDRRRMHFLRVGRVDIGDLEGRPWKFLNILLEKSRDEIEHTIEEMEKMLRPHEVRLYIYTALHLQSYFPAHLLRNHPIGLDPERVDSYFLEELCRLNADHRFFKGMDVPEDGSLHPFLVRYAVMYFDHEFSGGSLDNYIKEFFRRREFHHRNKVTRSIPTVEACKVFGISVETFKSMTRKELIQLYRQCAKKAHPDKGGDHETFVRMTDAYECLLAKK